MKKKHILYGTAAVLASATLGTATVSADTFIVNVDGVQTQMSEYENNLPIETVTAIEASFIESGFAEGLQLDHVDYSTPGTTIFNFTRPAAVTPAAVETRTFNFVVNVDGVEIQNQPMTLPVDEIEAWLQNEVATFTNATVERVVESGKVTLNVTSNNEEKPIVGAVPAAEKLEDYKLIVIVDGQEVQASDFILTPYSELEEHQSALVEAKLAEGLTFDAIDRVGNAFTLSFSTPAEAEKPAVSEKLENFKIIVKVDGKEVQVSDFEAITYSDFVNHLAAFTEAKLAEDLTYVSADFDGNTVTLSFETKDELKNPAKEDETSTDVNDDKKPTVKEETTDKKAEDKAKNPAVTLGNKKATAKKDAQYAKDATLPSTGDNSSATFAIAGLSIMGLGLAGVAKRKFNN